MRPSRDRDDRRRAYGLGLDAETRAAWMLRLKLYRVLARRFRGPGGEIDLIVARGRTVAFVEVKARPTTEAAVDAVTPHARARILATADRWVATHPFYAGHDRRFDIVVVRPGHWPEHRADAFRADEPDLPRFTRR